MNRFVQLFNAPSLDFWFPLLKETKFQNHRYTSKTFFQRARASSRSKNVTKSEETVPKLNISTELRILANRWTFRNSQVSELSEVSGNEAGSWSSLEKQENQRRRSSFWTNLTFQTERRLEIPKFLKRFRVVGSMRKRTRRLRGGGREDRERGKDPRNATDKFLWKLECSGPPPRLRVATLVAALIGQTAGRPVIYSDVPASLGTITEVRARV